MDLNENLDVATRDELNNLATRIWFIRTAFAARPELDDQAIDGLIDILDGIFNRLEAMASQDEA